MAESANDPAPVSTRPETAREHRSRYALVYAQKLTKLYVARRGLLRSPSLVHALNGVSFYIRRRETFGLIGESGCGKTTLGRCLLRLVEPTVGRVIFDGKDVTGLSPAELRALRRRMQIVFQNPYSSLDPNLTVQEIVREGIDVFGLAPSRSEGNALVADLLAQVGLKPDMAARYPHEFSGGQRQRIAIARALAVKPDFIVLDEPLSALDLSVQAQIVNLLDDLQQELGLTLLFISHDLRAVQYVSHRIGVMYLGKLVELGPTQLVVQRRYHPYTRALFGAVPTLRIGAGTRRRKRRLVLGLGAEPPSAIDPPPGCAFYAACPNAEAGRCNADPPPELTEEVKGSHHRVACWHPNVD